MGPYYVRICRSGWTVTCAEVGARRRLLVGPEHVCIYRSRWTPRRAALGAGARLPVEPEYVRIIMLLGLTKSHWASRASIYIQYNWGWNRGCCYRSMINTYSTVASSLRCNLLVCFVLALSLPSLLFTVRDMTKCKGPHQHHNFDDFTTYGFTTFTTFNRSRNAFLHCKSGF